MQKKSPVTTEKINYKRLFLTLLPVVIALAGGTLAIRRELWFDEALTLMNFVIPMDLGAIYQNYLIPNNHIVYSMSLKLFSMPLAESGLFDPVAVWRAFSMLAAAATIGLLMNLRLKLDDQRALPGALVLSVMACSMIFINYSTAIRGYALSMFFIALTLNGLYDIFHQQTRRGWIIYSISAILAVGTVPSNLLPLAAALLYAVPWMERKFLTDKRFYLAGAVLPLALIVFYAPIAAKFLATFRLGEGFPSRWGAILMVLGMYASCFGLLLLFAPWGIRKAPWQNRIPYLIWLLPMAAILILHRAPFPRVFVPMLPVLAMLVADGMAKVIGQEWKKVHITAFFMLALCVQSLLMMTGYVAAEKANLDPVDDDFFRAAYMQKSHRPSAVIRRADSLGGNRNIFISFNSDPLPMVFYAHMNNIDVKKIQIDVPYNSVKTLPPDSLVILHTRRDDPSEFEKRFDCRLEKAESLKSVTIYRASMPR